MKKGFTLVELSIVLVIIGLLIGGILVGQSLVNNAKLKRVMNDITQVKILTQNFITKYNCIPGDCSKSFIPSAYSGYQDNIIGYSSDARVFKAQLAVMGIYSTSEDLSDCKNSYNWRTAPVKCYFKGSFDKTAMHISETGPVQGSGLPTFYGYPYMNSTGAELNQQYIIYTGISNINDGSNYPIRGALLPIDAKALDEKFDDGLPNSGKIQGLVTYPDFQSPPTGYNARCTTSGHPPSNIAATYLVTENTNSCIPAFYLRKDEKEIAQ